MQTFEELAKIGTGPYKDSNFCTVAALAMTLDWSFGKAHRWMKKRCNRKNHRGLFVADWAPAIEQAAESVGKKFNRYRDIYTSEGKNMTIGRFCKEHPTGIFYVQVRGHALAIVNGEMLDWTANTAGRRRVIMAFKLEG